MWLSVRLAYWMSFCRSDTCQMLWPGPAGFHIWTEKMIELRRGLSSSTTSTGVFEYTPPSQYGSPSILIAGNAGGSAPGS